MMCSLPQLAMATPVDNDCHSGQKGLGHRSLSLIHGCNKYCNHGFILSCSLDCLFDCCGAVVGLAPYDSGHDLRNGTKSG